MSIQASFFGCDEISHIVMQNGCLSRISYGNSFPWNKRKVWRVPPRDRQRILDICWWAWRVQYRKKCPPEKRTCIEGSFNLSHRQAIIEKTRDEGSPDGMLRIKHLSQWTSKRSFWLTVQSCFFKLKNLQIGRNNRNHPQDPSSSKVSFREGRRPKSYFKTSCIVILVKWIIAF